MSVGQDTALIHTKQISSIYVLFTPNVWLYVAITMETLMSLDKTRLTIKQNLTSTIIFSVERIRHHTKGYIFKSKPVLGSNYIQVSPWKRDPNIKT
jgi:hypothetical protein